MEDFSPAQHTAGVHFVSAWSEPLPWLRAGFSTRLGGCTTAYSPGGAGDLNLGWTDADDPANVAQNRTRFLAAIVGDAPAQLVTLRQVHGSVVHVIGAGHGPLATPDGRAILEGDGLLSAQPGVMLGVQTADCVPVLVADTRTRAVAAFHAGWRGTLARIVEQGIATMQREFGSQPEDIIAAVGPAIRPCCFAIGPEVHTHFEREFAYAAALFQEISEDNRAPQLHMDLHEANRRQLLAAGLLPEAISVVAECTACTRLQNGRRKYFSHRAEHGFTGRMLSVIGTAAAK